MQEELWGDVRDWKDWRKRKAALIGQEMCSHNGGKWPVTLEEWKEAAAFYGFTLYILSGMSAQAETHDDIICVRKCSRPKVLQRRICHEIAEAIAKREGALRQFNFTSPHDEHHNVARLVEQNVQANLQARALAARKKQGAAQKRLADMKRQMQLLEEQLAADAQLLLETELLLADL